MTDILWALNEDGILILARPLNAAVNGIAVMSIALGCFFWYKFIESRLMLIRPDQKRLRRLVAVPIIVIILLDAISVFTGWLFFIDENNRYDSTSLFFIQSIVNYVYLLIPTVASLRRAVQTRSRLERGEYATYSVYMIAPLIAGLLEDVLPTVPMLALNIFMSEEFQRRLFEPFTQEGRNDSSEARGSGLGLAIVKKLVDLMGRSSSQLRAARVSTVSAKKARQSASQCRIARLRRSSIRRRLLSDTVFCPV